MNISGIAEEDVRRMADAIRLGLDADRAFDLACCMTKVDQKEAIKAPLLVLGMSMTVAEGAA